MCFIFSVNSIEQMTFDGPMAIAMPGSEDDHMPAMFFVNTKNPYKQPKWKLHLAVLREIAPGRLYQVWLSLDLSIQQWG